VTSLLLAAGCAPLFHDPTPSRSLAWQAKPWWIHCETAESHLPDLEAAPGVHRARWLWARDRLGRALELAGSLEDGFLVVSGIREAGSGDVRPTSLSELRRACLDTLHARDPEHPLELGKVRAARHGEDIDVTMVFPPSAPLPARPVRRMVVFGDSLSDTGRLKRRLHVFPAAPYWLGRFSNGPNWVDYLAASSGIAAQNHAYGGAVVTLHRDVPIEEWIARVLEGGQVLLTGSLERQIDDYLARTLGKGPVQQPDRTVFVLWAGANDYMWKESFSGEIATFLNSPGGAEGYRHVVDEVIEAIAVQLRKLHGAGARRFLVVNLPDLGRTPMVVENETYVSLRPARSDAARKLELSRRLSALTAYHNEQLRRMLTRLAPELPGGHLLHHDAAAQIEDVLEHRSQLELGFDLSTRFATLADATRRESIPQRCYVGGYLGSSDPTSICPDQEHALFWDRVHPTSYAHCWVARSIAETLARAGWVAQPPPVDAHRAWCEHVASGDRGRRETAWRLSGL
jgi:phospholipase/lecithinase/hemolysin